MWDKKRSQNTHGRNISKHFYWYFLVKTQFKILGTISEAHANWPFVIRTFMWRFCEITSETDRDYGIPLLGFIPIASTFKCNLIANNRGFQRFRPSDICLPDDPIIILIVHDYRPIHGIVRIVCGNRSEIMSPKIAFRNIDLMPPKNG